jgi:hypothetical protein
VSDEPIADEDGEEELVDKFSANAGIRGGELLTTIYDNEVHDHDTTYCCKCCKVALCKNFFFDLYHSFRTG